MSSQLSRRLSTSRFMVMQRLRHSWMRWHRRRAERRLAKAQDRLALLYRLGTEQLLQVQRLERALHHPETEAQALPEAPPSPPPVMAPAPVTPETVPRTVDPEPELEQTVPEEEPEPETAGVQISRLLGLPTPRSTSPSSRS